MSEDTITEQEKLERLEKFAARAHWGTSGQLPLKDPADEDNDISCGGEYWVEFREANGAQYDAITNAAMISRLDFDSEGVATSAIQEFSPSAFVTEVAKQGLIVGAVLFRVMEAADGAKRIENQGWPKDKTNQINLLAELTPEGIRAVYALAFDFYVAAREVVEEAKNSSTSTE